MKGAPATRARCAEPLCLCLSSNLVYYLHSNELHVSACPPRPDDGGIDADVRSGSCRSLHQNSERHCGLVLVVLAAGREMKRVFPDADFIELPFDHKIYHQSYEFNEGVPKIHEHDGKPAQGFGIFFEGRLVCFYDYECDLGDGWEDPEVHKDSEETRTRALRMGANILQYVLMGQEE